MPEDLIHYSKSTLHSQLMNLPEQIESNLSKNTNCIHSKKICIFAVGESTVAAFIIAEYSNTVLNHPINVISDGRVPGWINYDTTAILISYSGYSDVINSVYNELSIRNSTIISITSGGRLMDRSISENNTVYRLSQNLTPRTAVGAELGILASILDDANEYSTMKCMKLSLQFVKEFRKSLIEGKIISKASIDKLRNKAISVYGTAELHATYVRWKTAFNKDSMNLAFCSDLPEFDHNELVGWSNHRQPTDDIIMIVLKCETDYVLSKIIDSMIDVLNEHNRDVIVFDVPGSNVIEKNLCGILMGDYIAQKLSSKNSLVRGLSE